MNEIEKLINSVGAIAETAAAYFKTLVSQGVPNDNAAIITSAFVSTAMTMKKESGDT